MPDCRHQKLMLLQPKGKKLRCRHCHLTIDEKDLSDGICPECYEVSGIKRADFEQVSLDDGSTTRYSCEGCGIILKVP